jgi:hypothetical protein
MAVPPPDGVSVIVKFWTHDDPLDGPTTFPESVQDEVQAGAIVNVAAVVAAELTELVNTAS